MRRMTFDGYAEPEIREDTSVKTVVAPTPVVEMVGKPVIAKPVVQEGVPVVVTAPVTIPTIPAASAKIEFIKAVRDVVATVTPSGQVLPSAEALKLAATAKLKNELKLAAKGGSSTLLLLLGAFAVYKLLF